MRTAFSRPADLIAARRHLASGTWTAKELWHAARAAALSDRARHVFTHLCDGDPPGPGPVPGPLAGLAVSVKDCFDVAGEVTAAGSRVLADAAPARVDAPAVARLKAAGGRVIGRTNMTEFAYSGVGVNPHHGTPANPADPHTPRVPGGSSSGAAVSVAVGAAWVGLGTDTGGSLRIPAALCGLVGFKCSADRVPRQGLLPLSPTLDSVGAITRSVRDAILAHEVLAARRVTRHPATPSAWRLAVPQQVMLDELEPAVADAFAQTLRRLREAGACVEPIDLPELDELADLNASGGLVAPEAYAWHRELLIEHGARYDPRVRARIERGAATAAHEFRALLAARADWIARVQVRIAPWDALLSPTVPVTAPPLAEVLPADGLDPTVDAARDAAFWRLNALLLRNPSVVNFLDGCAISLPCHSPGALPVGLMLWHGHGHDDRLLNIALSIEALE